MVTSRKHPWAGSFPVRQLLGLPRGWEPQPGRGRAGVENWVLVGVAWLFWRLVSELESHHQQPASRPVEEKKEINLAPSLELYYFS